jgi:SET domain-containing protein
MMTVPVEVRKSEIHGLGIFAVEPIRKGQVLWEFTPGLDRKVSDYAVQFAEPRKRSFIMERGYFSAKNSHWVLCVDESQWWNFPRNGDQANCVLGGEQDGENLIIAGRDIAAGEELTICPESDGDFKRKMELR